MNPNQYITENYEQIKLWLYNITKGERSHLYEDFIHEVIMIFLQHDKAQDAIDSGTARFFLARIGLNQWRSNTSPFHYQYRDSFLDFPDNWEEEIEQNEEYDNTEDIMIDIIMNGLEEMYQGTPAERYEAIMLMMYYANGANYSAVGRQLNMPHTTIRKIVLRGLTKLKQIIFNNINDGTINNLRINFDFSNSWDDNGCNISQQTLSVVSQLIKTRYFEVFRPA